MKVSPLTRLFDRGGFHCGVYELERYLRSQASQDMKRHTAACFVLHDDSETDILGYFTLSSFSVKSEFIPAPLKKKLPRYPQIPATMLGRLAISSEAQGRGLGELLLFDALQKALKNSEVIASWAVFVDAINDDAARFYRHFDFREDGMSDGRLFLTMSEIEKIFA